MAIRGCVAHRAPRLGPPGVWSGLFVFSCALATSESESRPRLRFTSPSARRIEQSAAAPADEGLALRDIWLLGLRALLARAHGDAAAYAHLRDRYRDMARTLGFKGQIAWAEAMP
jgi:hypothetical protein